MENINMYAQFMPFLHTDMTQVVEIPPHVRHVLATEGARASATMMLSMLDWNNLVPPR